MNDKRYWHCDTCHQGITAAQIHDITDHKVCCWSCFNERILTVERFADHNGALFSAYDRSALWQWIAPGCTQIALFETRDGQEYCYDGWIEQSEKADGVCLSWVGERIPIYDFHLSNWGPIAPKKG